MYDVIAIGSATRDNFLKADFQLTDWPSAPSGKAIALPFGEKLSVEKFYPTIGGNAANASVTFARQNFKVACVAKIGQDLAGREFVARLEKEKVDVDLIAYSADHLTAQSTLLLKDGERTILGFHGASDTLETADLKLDQLKSSWWYLSLAGESDQLLLELLKFAKKNKIKVAFNPSGHHIKHKPKDILAAFKDLAFLVLNADEAAELVGISFVEKEKVFKKIDELMPGIVAVTDGPRGVTVSDGEYLYSAGIFPEKALVDRTGAGDAFGSGFVAGLMRKNDVPYAIRLASANATSVVENVGATEGILRAEEFTQSSCWQNLEIKVVKMLP